MPRAARPGLAAAANPLFLSLCSWARLLAASGVAPVPAGAQGSRAPQGLRAMPRPREARCEGAGSPPATPTRGDAVARDGGPVVSPALERELALLRQQLEVVLASHATASIPQELGEVRRQLGALTAGQAVVVARLEELQSRLAAPWAPRDGCPQPAFKSEAVSLAAEAVLKPGAYDGTPVEKSAEIQEVPGRSTGGWRGG